MAQCKAKINSGEQCSREAQEDSDYCWQHQKNEKVNTGRKTKYDSNMVKKVKTFMAKGKTMHQLANFLDISIPTLYEWKKKYPQFSNAIENGRAIADAKVENELYKNAVGFNYREQVLSNDGSVREVERFARAQVSAQKLWLKNRQPDKWKDKKQISGKLDINPVDAILKADEELNEDDE